MPTWGQMLKELAELQRSAPAPPTNPLAQVSEGRPSPHDILRRRYLKKLYDHTGRAVIVYATSWSESKFVQNPTVLQVVLSDVQGFMEAVSGVQERELDLFLHSPGGSAEAAESILDYLRTQFDHIRVVVPHAAMSAATMLALGADEILMGSYSQLGPIDPQFTIQTPEGPRSAPAQAILDQFEQAKEECQDSKNLAAWLPLLRGLMPGLLAQCVHQHDLAQELVAKWLSRYMFKGYPDADEHAREVAAWFSDFKEFKSHGRRVDYETAFKKGLEVTKLDDDRELQDAVLSVHWAFRHTLSQTGAVKIIENHAGRAYIEQVMNVIGVPTAQAAAPPQKGGTPFGGQLPRPPANRQQRRHPNR